jgi:hypothetical protein
MLYKLSLEIQDINVIPVIYCTLFNSGGKLFTYILYSIFTLYINRIKENVMIKIKYIKSFIQNINVIQNITL